MHLSELQTKEVINIATGKKMGIIIDVIIDNSGKIDEIILEERRSSRRFMSSKEESVIKWEQIIKIGDDIILVDNRSKKM